MLCSMDESSVEVQVGGVRVPVPSDESPELWWPPVWWQHGSERPVWYLPPPCLPNACDDPLSPAAHTGTSLVLSLFCSLQFFTCAKAANIWDVNTDPRLRYGLHPI